MNDCCTKTILKIGAVFFSMGLTLCVLQIFVGKNQSFLPGIFLLSQGLAMLVVTLLVWFFKKRKEQK